MSIHRIIIAIVFLLAGASIYLFFRQNVIFLSWIDPDILNCLHIKVTDDTNVFLMYVFIYCLPDALWYAALLILQIPFYEYGLLNRLLLYMCILLPYAIEVLQYCRLMPGTFDWLDILTYFITSVILILCERNRFCRLG